MVAVHFSKAAGYAEANHGWLVHVDVGVVGVEAVTVVSDKREFSGNGVGELMLTVKL